MIVLKNLLAIVVTISLFGCAGGKYNIVNSSDNEFAEKGKGSLITLEENYIDFKDPMGIVPSSQFIPYVHHDNDNKIISTGFYLINVKTSGKWLNIRKGNELVILADGKRIVSEAENTKIDHSFSTNSAITYYYDYAWYEFSFKDMKDIVSAKNIKIMVTGKDGAQEYGTKNSGYSINDSFYSQNNKFFNEQILPRK